MTDNEKRAHDLAVAVSIDVCKMRRELQKIRGEQISSFQIILPNT